MTAQVTLEGSLFLSESQLFHLNRKDLRGPSNSKRAVFWDSLAKSIFKVRWELLRSLREKKEGEEKGEKSNCRAGVTQSRKRKWLWSSLTSLPSLHCGVSF